MPFLEVWRGQVCDRFEPTGDAVTIGGAATNHLALAEDRTVSRSHAVLHRYGDIWTIKDIGSRNGTFVNGERLVSEQALRHDDEIRVGSTRLVFRSFGTRGTALTEALAESPRLTAREQDVLVELCRPLLNGDPFTEPATVKHIASVLFVSAEAVKQHLGRLYDKFEVPASDTRKRVTLANDALRRGSVKLSDLDRVPRD